MRSWFAGLLMVFGAFSSVASTHTCTNNLSAECFIEEAVNAADLIHEDHLKNSIYLEAIDLAIKLDRPDILERFLKRVSDESLAVVVQDMIYSKHALIGFAQNDPEKETQFLEQIQTMVINDRYLDDKFAYLIKAERLGEAEDVIDMIATTRPNSAFQKNVELFYHSANHQQKHLVLAIQKDIDTHLEGISQPIEYWMANLDKVRGYILGGLLDEADYMLNSMDTDGSGIASVIESGYAIESSISAFNSDYKVALKQIRSLSTPSIKVDAYGDYLSIAANTKFYHEGLFEAINYAYELKSNYFSEEAAKAFLYFAKQAVSYRPVIEGATR